MQKGTDSGRGPLPVTTSCASMAQISLSSASTTQSLPPVGGIVCSLLPLFFNKFVCLSRLFYDLLVMMTIISSLIMGVFFKFGTSPLYQSQVLFLSFNFMCISSQKIFGKCKTKGVKGQGVKYDPPKGVKISKWSKLNSDCRFGFLSKK